MFLIASIESVFFILLFRPKQIYCGKPDVVLRDHHKGIGFVP